MTDFWEVLQDLDQVLLAKLGGSTGTMGQLGQADFASGHPWFPPLELRTVINQTYQRPF